MQLSELTYVSSRSVMVDVHGREFAIKKHKGKERYYIQHATGQLTVTSLMKEIIPIDGSMADYVLNGWFQIYHSYELYKSFISAELSWVS